MAEWIHFTLFGIVVPTIKPKVYTVLGLMRSATKISYLILVGGIRVRASG